MDRPGTTCHLPLLCLTLGTAHQQSVRNQCADGDCILTAHSTALTCLSTVDVNIMLMSAATSQPVHCLHFKRCRSQWPRVLRRGSAVARGYSGFESRQRLRCLLCVFVLSRFTSLRRADPSSLLPNLVFLSLMNLIEGAQYHWGAVEPWKKV